MSAEDYKRKLSEYFFHSCAGMSLALAKQTGLLDVFYAADHPLTISEIAERNNSKDRYIEELLGSLVSAGVVEISDDSTQFHVPEVHKTYLRKYGILCSYTISFAERFNTVKECFKKDGAYDIDMLSSLNLKNIEFKVLDIMDLPTSFSEKYDWCFVQDVVNSLPIPEKGLSEMYRCLKPGHVLCLIEGALPGNMAQHVNDLHACLYYTASTFVCLPSSFQQADSAALGAMCQADDIRMALYKSGFKIIIETASERDKFSALFVCQK
ncbi:uncharacterized protein LOC121371377 [Gigantopelta aegis]|uniref:uncharacterized protein LOC121371377 n=1 Tax=Gigantopelta aegis TaxID=1735272 RepID=UPI001B88BFFD|nr:uncharacterized protein LOC121371377 [Gigantopelta aegis]XP_041353151.1 uncharacterized protein LOC121371377 [Gigantopelta aegis]XP_041353152.1 uncharacterized protein LOC121371377 [Gigantopelta aegis]